MINSSLPLSPLTYPSLSSLGDLISFSWWYLLCNRKDVLCSFSVTTRSKLHESSGKEQELNRFPPLLVDQMSSNDIIIFWINFLWWKMWAASSSWLFSKSSSPSSSSLCLTCCCHGAKHHEVPTLKVRGHDNLSSYPLGRERLVARGLCSPETRAVPGLHQFLLFDFINIYLYVHFTLLIFLHFYFPIQFPQTTKLFT